MITQYFLNDVILAYINIPRFDMLLDIIVCHSHCDEEREELELMLLFSDADFSTLNKEVGSYIVYPDNETSH